MKSLRRLGLLPAFFLLAACAGLSDPLPVQPQPFPGAQSPPPKAEAESLYQAYKVSLHRVGARVGLRPCTREDALLYMRQSGSSLDLGGYRRGQSEDDLGSALFVFLALPALAYERGAHHGATPTAALRLDSSAAREFNLSVEAFNRELAAKLGLPFGFHKMDALPPLEQVTPRLGPNAERGDWLRAYQVRYWDGNPYVLARSSNNVAAYMESLGEGAAAGRWRQGERSSWSSILLFAAGAGGVLWSAVPGSDKQNVAPVLGLSGLSFALSYPAGKRGQRLQEEARAAFNREVEARMAAKLASLP